MVFRLDSTRRKRSEARPLPKVPQVMTFNYGSTAYVPGEGAVVVGTMIPGPKPADDIFSVKSETRPAPFNVRREDLRKEPC